MYDPVNDATGYSPYDPAKIAGDSPNTLGSKAGGVVGNLNDIKDMLGLNNTFNAQQANLSENDFQNQIGGYFGQLQQDRNQNESFIKALQQRMAGNAPSVAQNQLNQTTGQNINRAAAMAASSKGVDPAIAAKMAIDAGANANQEAAGQAATLRANETTQAAGQLGQAIGNSTNANLNAFNTLTNANTAQNKNRIENLAQAQGINAKVEGQNVSGNQGILGGMMGGMGSAMSMFADGGEVDDLSYADDALKSALETKPVPEKKSGGISSLLPMLAMLADGGLVPGDSPKNDIVPARLSPGEIVLPRSVTQSPDAAEKAKSFVEAIKKTHKPNEKVEYKHVLAVMGGR